MVLLLSLSLCLILLMMLLLLLMILLFLVIILKLRLLRLQQNPRPRPPLPIFLPAKPFSLYKRLCLEKLIPTDISLQMADQSTTIPIGICEDVPVEVAN